MNILKEIKKSNVLNYSAFQTDDLILLKIFTYSCMNCLRSMKCVQKISNQYKRYGLKLILVHPYEWEFERSIRNINSALKRLKLNFPVIIDKDRKLIKKLGINFWPSDLLIKNGKIIYKQIGEGNYKKLEFVIRQNLSSKNAIPKNCIFCAYSKYPPVYCGRKKKGRLMPENTPKKRFGVIYVSGKWKQEKEFIMAEKAGDSVSIISKGRKVYMTASPKNKMPAEIIVKSGSYQRIIKITESNIYTMADFKKSEERLVRIIANSPMKIYSFGFE